ncbi:hypothetical protein OESDEN_00343 [Oesophagostomum dentatum]|uniref:Uncharacterized protein n=1 Tax=Oesophagostomum dentatum TaxID=61180 RepID=A0A0B1TU83_OESDE|nr:hypothetical protein OESDEN_00343 [Oesophagostomum dentatum]
MRCSLTLRLISCTSIVMENRIGKELINDSLVAHHLQELTVVTHKVQHLELEVVRLQKEKEALLSEQRSARAADARTIEELREQTSAFAAERIAFQGSLKELVSSLCLLRPTQVHGKALAAVIKRLGLYIVLSSDELANVKGLPL